jgi:hypothetical protein
LTIVDYYGIITPVEKYGIPAKRRANTKTALTSPDFSLN